jgi:hypothetical protein
MQLIDARMAPEKKFHGSSAHRIKTGNSLLGTTPLPDRRIKIKTTV